MNTTASLTAIDPNKYATIKRDRFVEKYGEAAEKLLREERNIQITSLIQQVQEMKKYDNGFGSFTTDLAIPDDWVGYNKACDDVIKTLQSQTEKGKAHE